jgi:hypothetical protein
MDSMNDSSSDIDIENVDEVVEDVEEEDPIQEEESQQPTSDEFTEEIKKREKRKAEFIKLMNARKSSKIGSATNHSVYQRKFGRRFPDYSGLNVIAAASSVAAPLAASVASSSSAVESRWLAANSAHPPKQGSNSWSVVSGLPFKNVPHFKPTVEAQRSPAQQTFKSAADRKVYLAISHIGGRRR